MISPPFRSYAGVLDTLRRVTDYERMTGIRYTPRNYNLIRMGHLMDRLGHPERGFRSIHVAGTKGKGSVCHMIEAILRRAGYKTGLYISPHLIDMLERIQINGRPISREAFVRVMNRLRPALRAVKPTYFEIMTAAAFLHFQSESVDCAVVEVGLGGRLDATNILAPDVAVITPIDYDHMDVLGHTLRKIACEKAGIIKPFTPVVCGPQPPEAMRVIRKIARIRSAPLYRGARGSMPRLRLLPEGRHQISNAGTAIRAVGILSRVVSLSVPRASIRKALGSLVLPGRIQTVHLRPRIIVDAAHNPVSVRALCDTLDRGPRYPQRILVFGTARDKDAMTMLKMLLPRFDRVIFTRSDNPRACDPSALNHRAFALRRRPYLQATGAERAFDLARTLAGDEDLIVVTGSFYLAGEVLQCHRGTL